MTDRNENLQRVRRIETQAAISGAMLRQERVAQRAIEKANAEAVAVDGEKIARIAQQRLKKRKGREEEKQRGPQQPQKKLTGVFFYMMLFLTVFKDLFDFVLTFTIILSFFIILINLVITFVVLLYYFVNDVKLTSRKLVVVVVGIAVEMFPLIGLLPMASISLIMVRMFENSERLSKIAEKRVGLVV